MVPWDWADVGVQLDEQKMNRVRCEKQRREDAGKVGEGLHWVHRQAPATHHRQGETAQRSHERNTQGPSTRSSGHHPKAGQLTYDHGAGFRDR